MEAYHCLALGLCPALGALPLAFLGSGHCSGQFLGVLASWSPGIGVGGRGLNQSLTPSSMEGSEGSGASCPAAAAAAAEQQVRVVRCPKCEKFLPELPNYSVYVCGGCGATLQGLSSFAPSLFILPPCSTLCYVSVVVTGG